jgi:hypothetical protein
MAIELIWDHCSQFNNPMPAAYYTQPVNILTDEYTYVVEFFVDGLNLIFKQVTYRYSEKQDTAYYDLGEFPDLLDNSRIMELVRRYANYVIEGYEETLLLTHCPSFEYIDHVDENYNSIY